MALWAIELGAFYIKYVPRTAMKSQVIANFIAEFSTLSQEAVKDLYALSEWELFVDGSSNVKGSRASMLLKSPHGDLIEHSLQFGFQASTNEAKYEALPTELSLEKKFGAK